MNYNLLFLIYGFAMLLNTQTVVTQVQPIIANHSIVEDYANIPQQYIDLIKSRWLSYAGESHSEALRAGLEALEDIDSRFQVSTTDNGTPQGPTTSYLRASRATWGDLTHASGWIYHYGEEDWFTSQAAVNRTIAGLSYINGNGFPLDYFGFGWCYDAADGVVSGGIDPVYHTRWGGVSVGGPDGNKAWGLDNKDSSLTGNSIDMQDYIDATLAYIQHCESNKYPTKVFFSTGTIDNEYTLAVGETGYQAFLKWEYLRNFVRSTDYALFDYADILSYNNMGVQETTSWTDHSSKKQIFPVIHPNNLDGGYMAHIGMNGALRLAKAMWWMMARLEGWNGLPVGTTDDYSIIGSENSNGNIDLSLDKLNKIIHLDIRNAQLKQTNYRIDLFDMSGRLLTTQVAYPGNNSICVNNFLTGGILLIKITNHSENYYFRILI